MLPGNYGLRMTEVPLTGGRTSTGVVRVGQAVHRPPTTNSEFVRSLLHHLETVSFDGAPRPLGTDEIGRDVFSYIDGQVPTNIGWYDDGSLAAAARLIRQYHDATVPLVDTAAASSVGIEIVCHNDLSPCNFVFRNGFPIALIDFDAAAPGSRCYDLAYAAWMWLDIGGSDAEAIEQRRRLQLFIEAYGDDLSVCALVKAIIARQRAAIAEGKRCGRDSMVRWATRCLNWTSTHLRSPGPK